MRKLVNWRLVVLNVRGGKFVRLVHRLIHVLHGRSHRPLWRRRRLWGTPVLCVRLLIRVHHLWLIGVSRIALSLVGQQRNCRPSHHMWHLRYCSHASRQLPLRCTIQIRDHMHLTRIVSGIPNKTRIRRTVTVPREIRRHSSKTGRWRPHRIIGPNVSGIWPVSVIIVHL